MDELRLCSHINSSVPELQADEIHLWHIDLRLDDQDLSFAEQFILDAEREHASRFYFAGHQRRYVAGRARLRQLLSRYLDCPPLGITFETGPAGKPSLGGLHQGELEFNFSHCEDRALLGVTRGTVIGVDIERIRVLEDASELVRLFFSPRESRLFNSLAPEQQPEAFFNLWTGKEAFLKATGEGITLSLHKVEVSFLPDEEAGIMGLPPELGTPKDWILRRCEAPKGFAASVVFAAPARRITALQLCNSNPEQRYEHASH
jgi:4'-phosphopantetheinyl transferase